MLIKQLAGWPRVVESAAEAHEPHRIAFYLQDVAQRFHGLWTKGKEDAAIAVHSSGRSVCSPRRGWRWFARRSWWSLPASRSSASNRWRSCGDGGDRRLSASTIRAPGRVDSIEIPDRPAALLSRRRARLRESACLLCGGIAAAALLAVVMMALLWSGQTRGGRACSGGRTADQGGGSADQGSAGKPGRHGRAQPRHARLRAHARHARREAAGRAAAAGTGAAAGAAAPRRRVRPQTARRPFRSPSSRRSTAGPARRSSPRRPRRWRRSRPPRHHRRRPSLRQRSRPAAPATSAAEAGAGVAARAGEDSDGAGHRRQARRTGEAGEPLAASRCSCSSSRSADEAQDAWAQLKDKNGDLLGALSPTVARADLGDRGTFYRLRAGPLADEAKARAHLRFARRPRACPASSSGRPVDVAERAPRAVIFGVAGPTLSEAERGFFADADPLGFILFARNCSDPEQVRALVDDLRTMRRARRRAGADRPGRRAGAAAEAAALAGGAGRGGRSATFARATSAAAVEAAWLNAPPDRRRSAPTRDRPSTARRCSTSASRTRTRSSATGRSPASRRPVALLGRATCAGLLAGGVLPVIKHIPGHGRAARDSHEALPVVDAALAELRARRLRAVRGAGRHADGDDRPRRLRRRRSERPGDHVRGRPRARSSAA